MNNINCFNISQVAIHSDNKNIFFLGVYSFEERCTEVLSRISQDSHIGKISFIQYNNQLSHESIKKINENKQLIQKLILEFNINTNSPKFEEKLFLTDDVINFMQWAKDVIINFKESNMNELWVDISCLTKLHTFILLKLLKENNCPSKIFYTTPQYYGQRPTIGISEPLIQIPFTKQVATIGTRWALIACVTGKEEARCFRIIYEFMPEIIIFIWPEPGNFHFNEDEDKQKEYQKRYKTLFSLFQIKEISLSFDNIENANNKIRDCLEGFFEKGIFNCAISNIGPKSASVALAFLSHELYKQEQRKSCVRYAYIKPGFYNWKDYSRGIGQVWEITL